MADFFTDSDDDKAVEEILSQAMDSTVLEQVAAINCAGFTDSGLPSHLETRFQRLKSFPSSAPKPASLSTKSFNPSHPPDSTVKEEKDPDPVEGENGEKAFTTCLSKSPEEKGKSFLSDSGGLSPFKKIPQGKMEKKGTKSPSFSSNEGFSSRSVSPPVRSGCFLCSPKKVSRRKSMRFDLGKPDDELLSDLTSFSLNIQKRLIKKAMEEEEKICREAEKIVKWAKHASARMDVSGIEDELSDDENAKFP